MPVHSGVDPHRLLSLVSRCPFSYRFDIHHLLCPGRPHPMGSQAWSTSFQRLRHASHRRYLPYWLPVGRADLCTQPHMLIGGIRLKLIIHQQRSYTSAFSLTRRRSRSLHCSLRTRPINAAASLITRKSLRTIDVQALAILMREMSATLVFTSCVTHLDGKRISAIPHHNTSCWLPTSELQVDM